MLFILLIGFFPLCWARSERYYEIIKDMNAGINYYEYLGLTSSAGPAEIKKAYRVLLLKLHPDKNKEPGAIDKFLILQKSYEILTNEETKKEYDTFLRDGIPFQEQYYGRYMHDFGAPQHDPSTVLFWLVIIITIGKYLYQWHRHESIKKLAATTLRYKTEVNKLKAAGQDTPPEVLVHGAEMPTWRDLFVYQLLIFVIYIPVNVGKFIIFLPELARRIKSGHLFHQPTEAEIDEMLRAKLGISEEEFVVWKEEQTRKRAEMMQSGRAKRYRRWLKKQ